MASRLLGKQSRIVAYLPNLRAAVRHFRAFSSYDENARTKGTIEVILDDATPDLPDPALGVLNPQDPHFPLPGMIRPAAHLQAAAIPTPVLQRESDLLTEQLPTQRHMSVLQQFIHQKQQEAELAESAYVMEHLPSPLDMLECVAQQCPELMRKDFKDLFPERDMQDGALTVITLSQKTQNDMSGWSPDVEEERTELLGHFISGAEDICANLHQAGYWADFIEPSSGRPYLGAFTNATMFETDERYRNFGFDIEDLGCCKVISHHLWGTHAYVGCLFTDAPHDHPVLLDMLNKEG